ncbi:hypothetical protein [Methylobacterium sp. AMS5]|uniref:hypothetical protein n=1 Tax=Methylobacterium sp. AMS5 TaxID=925818 RepID=UPI002570A572|nr:hypothetical protein [Methylobacterium sp. AMS5]
MALYTLRHSFDQGRSSHPDRWDAPRSTRADADRHRECHYRHAGDRRGPLANGAEPAPGGRERVPLDDAAGRICAEALAARLDVPPFAVAAMDGYARAGPRPTPSWLARAWSGRAIRSRSSASISALSFEGQGASAHVGSDDAGLVFPPAWA